MVGDSMHVRAIGAAIAAALSTCNLSKLVAAHRPAK